MNRLKIYIPLALIFIFLIKNISAQPIQQWTARFNGLHDSTDVAKDIAVDDSGNVYVTGYTTSLVLFTQIATIKYNPAGVLQWRTLTGNILFSEGNAIVLDDSGYVYVAGYLDGLLNLTGDYVVIKYYNNGNIRWIRTFDGTAHGMDIAYSLKVDNLYNVYVTGAATMNGLILGNIDYVTLKYDLNGNLQWVADYDGPAHSVDIATKITKDPFGNVIVTGSSRSGIFSGSEDYATVKYNPGGVQQWASRYDGPANSQDAAYYIITDGSGNVYVTGSSTGNGSGLDYATIKYNSAGNQQWVSRYNGTGNGEDRAYAIIVDNSDNVIVTGESQNSGSTHDYATVKYNSAGNQQWASRYNNTGTGEDRAYAIVVDNSDNVYVTGESTGSSSGQDYATVKYDTNGSQQWAVRYDGNSNEDRAYAIIVDNSDNIYITGQSRHSSLLGSEDYLTIKYSNINGITGIKVVSLNAPGKFSLYQNYPNPFNPGTKIKFDIVRQSNIHISVYDLLGKKIEDLVNEKLKPGTYEISVNAENIPSGIYFYRLIADDYTETKKMILLK